MAMRMGRIEEMLGAMMAVGGELGEVGDARTVMPDTDLRCPNGERKSMVSQPGGGGASVPYSPFQRPRDRLSALEGKMDKVLAALSREGRLGEFEA